MALEIQAKRTLSPLEKAAMDLAFDGAIDPDALTIEVPHHIEIGNDWANGT